jgi:hypothetical protein
MKLRSLAPALLGTVLFTGCFVDELLGTSGADSGSSRDSGVPDGGDGGEPEDHLLAPECQRCGDSGSCVCAQADAGCGGCVYLGG